MDAVTIRRLTPGRMEDLAAVLRGSWGAGCWCMYPRLTAAGVRELPGSGSGSESARRKAAMTGLARRRRAPGVEAYPRASSARVKDDLSGCDD